jgi:lysophospholipase L1-like esterase
VPDLERRLERDVLARKPNEVLIFIGINDVWHSLRGSGTPLPEYEAGLRRMIERIKAQGATVTLCTPTVIGERAGGANPLDIQLDAYADAVRQIAAAEGLAVVDLRKTFCERLGEADEGVQPTADAARPPLTTDGVHLSAAGNALVAEQLLEHFEGRAPKAR